MQKILLGGVVLFAPTLGFTAESPNLERKVKLLEQRLDDLTIERQEGTGRVKTFLRDNISLGGYFEHETLGIWGPDTAGQVSTALSVLALNLNADFSEELHFSSQILSILAFPLQNPNSDPRGMSVSLPASREFGTGVFATGVAQSYIEYRLSSAAHVQVGLGYVPFGIALQQLELVLFKRTVGPQLLSSSGGGGVTLVSSRWGGVHVLGRFGIGSGRWGYDAYTFTPRSNTKTLGGGTRLWWSPNDTLTLGASQQTGKRGGNPYTAWGTDAKLILGRFGFDSEAIVNTSQDNDPWSFYFEPYFKLIGDEFLVFGAIDYFDNPLGQTGAGSGALNDPYRKLQYAVGMNWLPISYTRFRLEFLFNDYRGDTATLSGQNRDYYQLDFSAGVAF